MGETPKQLQRRRLGLPCAHGACQHPFRQARFPVLPRVPVIHGIHDGFRLADYEFGTDCDLLQLNIRHHGCNLDNQIIG